MVCFLLKSQIDVHHGQINCSKRVLKIHQFHIRKEAIPTKQLEKGREIAYEENFPSLQRSVLFPMEPIPGESLYSFMGRVAEAHCITMFDLIDKIIVPHLRTRMRVNLFAKHRSPYWPYTMRVLNWIMGDPECHEALEELMQLHNFSCLTFMRWREGFEKYFLLKEFRAWCPHCLQEQQDRGIQVHEKLSWVVQGVFMCTTHRTFLRSSCDKCSARLPLLDKFMRPGYCSKCFKWLGYKYSVNLKLNSGQHILGPLKDLPSGSSSKEEGDAWRLWIAYNIEDFIRRTINGPMPPMDEKAICKAISKYINCAFDGSVRRFAEKLKVRDRDLWAWSELINSPALGELLHICWTVKTTLYDFLTGAYLETRFHRSSAKSQATTLRALQEKLERIIERNDVVQRTLGDVATETGYEKEFLLQHFRELCKKILAGQKKHRKNKRMRHLRYIQHLVRKESIALVASSYMPIWRLVKVRLRWNLDPDTVDLEQEDVVAIWRDTMRVLERGDVLNYE